MILGYMCILNCTINPQHKNPKLRCSGGTPTRSTAMAFNPSLMTRSRAMAKAGWRSLCLSIRDGPFLGHLPQRWQGGRGAAWQGQCWISSIGIKSSSTQMHGFKLVSAINWLGVTRSCKKNMSRRQCTSFPHWTIVCVVRPNQGFEKKSFEFARLNASCRMISGVTCV